MRNILLCFLYAVQTHSSIIADYYWRDYEGSIPCDALQGGADKFGHYTYIGQVAALDPNSSDLPDIVSAIIYKDHEYAYAAYHGRVFKSNKGVKILCTSTPKKYKWLNSLNSDCTLVRGSFTANYTNFYIGRVNYYGHNVTGRFSTIDQTLHVPWNDTPNTLQTFKSFEKLMYCGSDNTLVVSPQ
ncbi:hypothetical protein FQA39_LY16738 [Lamprigera yunnana]|nr:hypothetical protein FQA39_LY16738 [Lamprigera yunnana]